MKIMNIDFKRFYERNHLNFFVVYKSIDTVYFWVKFMKRAIQFKSIQFISIQNSTKYNNSVAFQANLIPHAWH